MMTIDTVRFGQIDVDENSTIRMPRGLVGFEDAREFCLVQHRPGAAFRWLQCMTRPELAFVVIDPSEFFDDYDLELSPVEAEYLGIECEADALVLTTVNLAAGSKEVTTNLLGPIVINTQTLVGMQVVIDDEGYGTAHSLTRRTTNGAKEVLARAA